MAGKVDDKKKEGANQKQELVKMKKAVGYASVDDMDKRMAEIDYQLVTSSMALKDEKKLVAELQQLKKDRPKIAQIHSLSSKLDSADKGEGLRSDMKLLSEQMGALNDSRKDVTGDLGEIFAKRDEISAKIKELSGK